MIAAYSNGCNVHPRVPLRRLEMWLGRLQMGTMLKVICDKHGAKLDGCPGPFMQSLTFSPTNFLLDKESPKLDRCTCADAQWLTLCLKSMARDVTGAFAQVFSNFQSPRQQRPVLLGHCNLDITKRWAQCTKPKRSINCIVGWASNWCKICVGNKQMQFRKRFQTLKFWVSHSTRLRCWGSPSFMGIVAGHLIH